MSVCEAGAGCEGGGLEVRFVGLCLLFEVSDSAVDLV